VSLLNSDYQTGI